jgi:accessory gene regulator B
MMDKLIFKSTEYLIHQKVIDEDDRDVYEYGFHSLYSNVINIICIISISLFLKMVPQVILYHIVFISLRSSAGGYHSSTYLRCFLVSTTVLLLSLFGMLHLKSSLLYIGFAFFSVIIIWMKAPVEHFNSPLGVKKRKRLKYISRVLSILFFIAILILIIFIDISLRWIAVSIAFGMVSHTLLFVAAIAKDRMIKNSTTVQSSIVK